MKVRGPDAHGVPQEVVDVQGDVLPQLAAAACAADAVTAIRSKNRCVPEAAVGSRDRRRRRDGRAMRASDRRAAGSAWASACNRSIAEKSASTAETLDPHKAESASMSSEDWRLSESHVEGPLVECVSDRPVLGGDDRRQSLRPPQVRAGWSKGRLSAAASAGRGS